MEQNEAIGTSTINIVDMSDSDSLMSEGPLDAVETDLRELMNNIGKLNHEMLEYKDKSEYGMRKLMLDFIDVADAFGNVFRNIEPRLDSVDQQTRIWINNFRTIYRLLQRTFTSWDVVQLEIVIGEKVNPYWHIVTEVEENPEREDETIIEEIKKGYMWNGKLLRPAEVKAVKNNL